jgi:hypothetical protein
MLHVPFFFAFDEKYLYSFSTVGRKIESSNATPQRFREQSDRRVDCGWHDDVSWAGIEALENPCAAL